MAIDVTCPTCGNQGRFPDEWHGRTIECPRCAGAVRVMPAAAFEPAGPGGWDTLIPLDAEITVGPAAAALAPPAPPGDPAIRLWVDAETKKFDGYVQGQLASLRKQRHEWVNAQAHEEMKFVALQQDLSRRAAVADARDAELRGREAEVERRLQEVAAVGEDLAGREAGLADYTERRSAAEEELARLVEEAGLLRQEANALRESVRAGRLELGVHRKLRQEMESKQVALEARLANCDRREAQIDRDDTAVRQRTAEVQEMEAQVERELEERNRELDAWQRLLDEREKNLAQRMSATTPPPRGLPAARTPRPTPPEGDRGEGGR